MSWGLLTVQARAQTLKRIQVPNIIGSLPLQYSVYADADWFSGPASLSCASASRGDTYKLSVCPLVSGTHWGSITFMAPDGNYCWYSVEVHVTHVQGLQLLAGGMVYTVQQAVVLCPVQRSSVGLLLGCSQQCVMPCACCIYIHCLGVCCRFVQQSLLRKEASVPAALRTRHLPSRYARHKQSCTHPRTSSSLAASCGDLH